MGEFVRGVDHQAATAGMLADDEFKHADNEAAAIGCRRHGGGHVLGHAIGVERDGLQHQLLLVAEGVVEAAARDAQFLDEIMQAGGFVSVNTGGCQDANCLPVAKRVADDAFDAATCIGCGACAAACKNSSAMLFISAKVSQLSLLPQGQPERERRVLNMMRQADKEGFGSCTNTLECEAVCPKEISASNIARLNREFMTASLLSRED